MSGLEVIAVIPAFNAAGSVGAVAAGALRHVREVIVVDDGSADETAARARDAGARVVSHAGNMGKGAALKTGFALALKSGCGAVVTLDADGQHDPEDIPRLIGAAIGPAGIVIGARLWDRAKIPPARYWANMVGVKAISWRTGSALGDSQSGFRLYKSEVIAGLDFTGGRFETETELLIRAGLKGFKIASVPVRAAYSEDIIKRSHFRAVADTYRICMLFLRSFFWSRH